MSMTQMPAFAQCPTRHLVLPAVRAVTLLGAVLLTVQPASAQGPSLNTNTLRLAEPVTVIQPNARPAMPALNTNTLRLAEPVTVIQPNARLTMPNLAPNPPALQVIAPNTARIAPILAPVTKPAIDAIRLAPTAAAAGLGRLVAPGNEGASVLVGRIGSTIQADLPGLTVDFDGDGLINFAIAPGIVDVPAGTTDPGGDALAGLVGQNIAMAADVADRVLDSVINVEGVVSATTFEIDNGTVVLGGIQTDGVAGRVDVLPVPDGPPAQKPADGDPRDPVPGTIPDDLPGDLAGGGETPIPGGNCGYNRCPPGPKTPLPGPGNAPNLDDIFQFTGFMTPPRPESDQDASRDELIDVSIMLPLRSRERQGDQFSNHGNEEIW